MNNTHSNQSSGPYTSFYVTVLLQYRRAHTSIVGASDLNLQRNLTPP